MVEMFTVCARSAPVPTTSTAGPSMTTRVERSSIVWTRPASSSGVSPLARSSTTKAASCAGVAAPAMISSIAHAVSAASSASARIRAVRTPGQLRPVSEADIGYRTTGTPELRWRSCSATVAAASTGSRGG